MCLAIPMRLIERNDLDGLVEIDGVSRRVSLMLLPDARVGEFLLIHTGYAIQRLNEKEAAETLALLREYLAATEVM